jgi:hypothetical protein
LTKLSIRLNKISKVRWFCGLISILMRSALTIYEFASHNYEWSTLKYYYTFVLDQLQFMVMLTLFFSVIGSWKII